MKSKYLTNSSNTQNSQISPNSSSNLLISINALLETLKVKGLQSERPVFFGGGHQGDPEYETFRERFASEERCISFLYQTKWPDGFRCPRCNKQEVYVMNSRRMPLYQCRTCRHQTSLTVGTVMHGSRTSLLKWFSAIFFTSRTDVSTNAIQLCDKLNVTYKTAWYMLNRIRYSIGETDNDYKLTQTISGGVGLCGKGPIRSTMNLHPQEKPFVLGASLDPQGHLVSIKMKLLPAECWRDTTLLPSGLIDFKEKYIDKLADQVNIVQRFGFSRCKPIKKLMNSIILHLTRTFNGLGSRHLQSYMDEACYRINLILQGKPIFNDLSRLCALTRGIATVN